MFRKDLLDHHVASIWHDTVCYQVSALVCTGTAGAQWVTRMWQSNQSKYRSTSSPYFNAT